MCGRFGRWATMALPPNLQVIVSFFLVVWVVGLEQFPFWVSLGGGGGMVTTSFAKRVGKG